LRVVVDASTIVGPAHGRIDLDLTNNLVVQDEHVVLG
jgi:hypothetical protein